MPPPKAVLFDVGGVVVLSPMIAIYAYEKRHNLPANYINHTISRSGPKGAWSLIERGEVKLDATFFAHFSADLNSPEHWKSFHEKMGLPAPATLPTINGEALFWEMMAKAREFDPLMVNAIRRLRATGKFKLGALTNDYQHPPGHPYADNSAVRALFDAFVSSSESGMRKPEEGFYRLALEKLGVPDAKDVVFLDDIGTNLKAARQIGFRTIRVEIGKSREAIKQLEELTGESLLDNNVGSKL